MIFFFLACSEPPPSLLCNNEKHLCERRVNEVSFPTSHNSMSSAEADWIAPNHLYAIPRQLDDGIRGLNLDTYLWEGEASLCHGYCELGQVALIDVFIEIKSFIDINPNEVILLSFQDALGAELTVQTLKESNLLSHLYHHELGNPWPTLKELIESQKQIIAFSSSGGDESNGLHDQWTHWIDNPYSALSIEDFSCAINRGQQENATLFNLNHFLTNPIALQSLAEEGNHNPILRDHIFSCIESIGQIPNQIMVDFYSIGDLFLVAEEINQQFDRK